MDSLINKSIDQYRMGLINLSDLILELKQVDRINKLHAQRESFEKSAHKITIELQKAEKELKAEMREI